MVLVFARCYWLGLEMLGGWSCVQRYARPELGYQVVGFLDDNPVRGHTDIGPYKALGPIDNFPQVIAEEAIDNVIICLPWQSHRYHPAIATHL